MLNTSMKLSCLFLNIQYCFIMLKNVECINSTNVYTNKHKSSITYYLPFELKLDIIYLPELSYEGEPAAKVTRANADNVTNIRPKDE